MHEWTSQKPIYIFCPECGDKAWINENHQLHCKDSTVDSVPIGGISVISDFISSEEEDIFIKSIDTRKPWVDSQEGRRKQDYGPKVSFLKKRACLGNFGGFPDFAVSLFDRMSTAHAKLLQNFIPVEFCILEYTPERGSYIRPHYDDFWIWGDRLITVNLLSETVLRFTKEFRIPPYEILVRMPARSLVVIQGESRYEWHHSINRYDIKTRRIAMTWREFSEEILEDKSYQDFIREVFDKAKNVEAPAPKTGVET